MNNEHRSETHSCYYTLEIKTNDNTLPAAYRSMHPFSTSSAVHEMQIESSHHHLHP